MSLTIEWRDRLDAWRRELRNHLYRPLGAVPLEAFFTTEILTAAEAGARGGFAPAAPGTPWGRKWEYGWFRGSVTLPPEARNRRIELRLDTGGESAVYVDGKVAGAADGQHRYLTLARRGRPGDVYRVLAESYGGHGPMVCSTGPTPRERATVPEPPALQKTVGETTFGVWNEDAYQLLIDVETLAAVRDNADPDSLRVAEIDRALRDFCVIVEFESGEAELRRTVREARRALRGALACANGPTAPRLFAFGHSHIDVAWLWPLEETMRKTVRTLATQVALMEEYPEFRFLQSQPHLYRMLKERDPELYERVRRAARRGQLIPDGGMWVEADVNLTGGESLIRQFIHGKRFFREEFGVESGVLWLPDVFGYSGALPQIMLGCGARYFATAKIFWNYHGGDPFPHNTFVWRGIDGSEVLVHLCNDYNSTADPAALIRRWNERVQKDGFSTRLFPFGFGDGGGGPTRDHLEFLRRERNLEGVPRAEPATPLDYFRDQEKRGRPDRVYVGELYYQCHRGTYTSQARTKRGNRKSELALREAELWGAAAAALAGRPFPAAEFDGLWKTVLLHQFHDILPGSSIGRVYEETEEAHRTVISSARNRARESAGALLRPDPAAATVFNSLSWPRTALVELPGNFAGAADADGRPLPCQRIDGKLRAEVVVPACGWTPVRAAPVVRTAGGVAVSRTRMENEFLRLTFNERGEITGMLDKETGLEAASGPCNALCMYRDVPSQFDAWDIDSMYPLTPVDLPGRASVAVAAAGPLAGVLRVERTVGGSRFSQEISLRRGSRRVEFATVVDWRERHKMLKVAFPVSIRSEDALHEIQFGHIRRPAHLSRPFDADRFEVCCHKWTAVLEETRGFAVLNDCKYGVNVRDGSINLTLLRSPLGPDMAADRGRQEFTYACFLWNGPFADSTLVRQGYELNCPPMLLPGAAAPRSLFSVDDPGVVVETVKPAEDGSGDVVVRLYESRRTTARCILTVGAPVAAAALTDMLEGNPRPVPAAEGRIALEFRPFEIKTVRLAFGGRGPAAPRRPAAGRRKTTPRRTEVP